jgi:endoglucanase
MLSSRHRQLVVDLLSLPTAPFTEEAIREHIFNFCNRRSDLKVTEDHVGNILVHYKRKRQARPVCLTAHMDHPGFRVVRMKDERTVEAQWLGGVPPEYFPKAGVRFHTADDWIKGQIQRVRLTSHPFERNKKVVDTVDVQLRGRQKAALVRGSAGMWDLPDPKIKGTRIHARACDDLAGCAAMLCTIDRLVRQSATTEAYFLFTRAEEVGFIGAIAACRARTIPKRCVVVAIETSSVIPGVIMGDGPILRVGDKTSIFTPKLTAWCGQVAEQLAARKRSFKYQRKLMDGGSCESSAYCQLGYDATGLCIALGNYHNCDRARQRIAPEYVDLNDLANLAEWFFALLTTPARLEDSDRAFVKKLGQLERRYARLLKSTA